MGVVLMDIKNILIKFRKLLGNIMGFYLIYVTIFGLIIFGLIKKPVSNNYLERHPVDRFFGSGESQDRVALIEDRYYSGLARVDLIEEAKESLDISYYTLHRGRSTDIFLGSILEAANRGIQVRFLLDGIFHHLERDYKDVIYTFTNHPNIELKFYEPFNPLRPWTWNNRLHDKFIIVDRKMALIGGRNIGDKYFAQDNREGRVVNDRDVLILNTGNKDHKESVIFQLEEYFNLVWNHKYSTYPKRRLTRGQVRKGERMAKILEARLKEIKKSNPEIFNHKFNWYDKSFPTKKITLIHNPLERIKEPWVYCELTNLAREARESIFVQSPYLIPTRQMLKFLEFEEKDKEINILTNSLYSSPNPLAIAGYMNHRKNIVNNSSRVYEYQGPGSIHAKTYIFDNRISAVGSFNFDARSTYLSTETMVVIDSEEFTKHLKREISNYQEQSLVVNRDYGYLENREIEAGRPSIVKKIIIKLLSLLVYFFDFLL